MTAEADISRSEKVLSGALALAMHLLFFALLVFGLSWQGRHRPETMVAELWRELPPIETKPEPAPAPKAEPKPEPKPEPKAAPQPEPKAQKPEIALREKKERERKAKEEAEKKKREQERLAALKERQEKEAQARAAREQEEAPKKLAAQQAAAQARLVDEYKRRISEKIKRFIVFDSSTVAGNAEAEFDVVLLPGGEVLGVKLRRSSGLAAWDSAVERAILRAQPLPLPPDPALFRDFRELHLKFRPKE